MREHSKVSGALSGRAQCHRPSGPVCRPPHGRILTFSPGWVFPTEPEQGFPLAHLVCTWAVPVGSKLHPLLPPHRTPRGLAHTSSITCGQEDGPGGEDHVNPGSGLRPVPQGIQGFPVPGGCFKMGNAGSGQVCALDFLTPCSVMRIREISSKAWGSGKGTSRPGIMPRGSISSQLLKAREVFRYHPDSISSQPSRIFCYVWWQSGSC